MTDVATVYNRTQIGVETTKGTPVAPTKILTATQLVPAPQITGSPFRPSGYKYNTLWIKGKEWTEAPVSGVLTYTEVVYLLSGVIGTAAITTPGGATLARQWLFTPVSSGPDLQKAYTVEYGSSVRGRKFSYGLFTAFGFTANRDEIPITGTLMGQRMTDDVVMTPALTEIVPIPVQPDHVSLYIADTAAGLDGATALTRGFGFEFGISGKNGPIWTLNRANPSYAGDVELAPDLSAVLTVGTDDVGMGLLDTMRASATKFIRFEAIGPIIEAAIPYTFVVDFYGKVSEPGSFEDNDGVEQIAWGLTGVHDSVAGEAFTVKVINTLTAL
jgi:hypothetical protein